MVIEIERTRDFVACSVGTAAGHHLRRCTASREKETDGRGQGRRGAGGWEGGLRCRLGGRAQVCQNRRGEARRGEGVGMGIWAWEGYGCMDMGVGVNAGAPGGSRQAGGG